jgi:hypothetical protein
MEPTTEHELQNAVLQALRAAGALAFRLNSGLVKRGARRIVLLPPGTPDVLAVLPGGRCVWLECKHGRGQLRPEQHAMHAQLLALGHAVYVVRSLADVIDVLNADALTQESI